MRSDPTSTRTIRCVRTDMASYYTGHEFSSTLRKKGIIQQFSAPYVPQQNGLAERLNRTIIEAERTAIHQSQMSIMFWGYALEAASLSYNLTPHAANDFLSPHELLFGEAPSVNNLKPFGISCTYLLQGNIQKFDQKGRSANLIGYTPFTKAYKLWDSLDQKLVLTNDVKFVNNSTVDDDNNDNSNQDPMPMLTMMTMITMPKDLPMTIEPQVTTKPLLTILKNTHNAHLDLRNPMHSITSQH